MSSTSLVTSTVLSLKCTWKCPEGLSVTNLSSENNLPTFRLNAPVIIRAKVSKLFSELKLVTDNLLFIYAAAN